MKPTVDARGLSCPQPVLMTLAEIGKIPGDSLLVLVDTDAAKENVTRAVRKKGWQVAGVTAEGDTYRLEICKG